MFEEQAHQLGSPDRDSGFERRRFNLHVVVKEPRPNGSARIRVLAAFEQPNNFGVVAHRSSLGDIQVGVGPLRVITDGSDHEIGSFQARQDHGGSGHCGEELVHDKARITILEAEDRKIRRLRIEVIPQAAET